MVAEAGGAGAGGGGAAFPAGDLVGEHDGEELLVGQVWFWRASATRSGRVSSTRRA
jgi:hypothetical protein